jgi:hypothetical protein
MTPTNHRCCLNKLDYLPAAPREDLARLLLLSLSMTASTLRHPRYGVLAVLATLGLLVGCGAVSEVASLDPPGVTDSGELPAGVETDISVLHYSIENSEITYDNLEPQVGVILVVSPTTISGTTTICVQSSFTTSIYSIELRPDSSAVTLNLGLVRIADYPSGGVVIIWSPNNQECAESYGSKLAESAFVRIGIPHYVSKVE